MKIKTMNKLMSVGLTDEQAEVISEYITELLEEKESAVITDLVDSN